MNCGNDLERLKVKLKDLKMTLKQWREQVFDKDKAKQQTILEEIENLDKVDDNGELQDEMRIRRTGLMEDLKKLAKKENAMVKQKARAEWLAKGDINSKFYHAKLRWRLLNNEVRGLPINGEWCEEPILIKKRKCINSLQVDSHLNPSMGQT